MPLEKAMGIGHGQGKMGMPVTVAMGNAYYVFFMPMVIATRMRMPTVMGMPMTMCTGTYTIGKHASRTDLTIFPDKSENFPGQI